jgi:hypothetical protein
MGNQKKSNSYVPPAIEDLGSHESFVRATFLAGVTDGANFTFNGGTLCPPVGICNGIKRSSPV